MSENKPRNTFAPFIVGIGGTSRNNSTSERAVAYALSRARQCGAEVRLFDGAFVSQLPLYVPDRHCTNAAELEFIASIRRCHGVIVATPGYHGGVSGPVKNILDLLEDTARDQLPYLEGRSFGCIVTAHGWQACGTALTSLRMIAHALRAWPTPFGATLNASTPLFHGDGSCIEDQTSNQINLVADQVIEFACQRHAGKAARNLP